MKPQFLLLPFVFLFFIPGGSLKPPFPLLPPPIPDPPLVLPALGAAPLPPSLPFPPPPEAPPFLSLPPLPKVGEPLLPPPLPGGIFPPPIPYIEQESPISPLIVPSLPEIPPMIVLGDKASKLFRPFLQGLPILNASFSEFENGTGFEHPLREKIEEVFKEIRFLDSDEVSLVGFKSKLDELAEDVTNLKPEAFGDDDALKDLQAQFKKVLAGDDSADAVV